VIRAGILEEIHCKYIIYQLLKALHFLHGIDLIHRCVRLNRSVAEWKTSDRPHGKIEQTGTSSHPTFC
jgi:hypothetical protein